MSLILFVQIFCICKAHDMNERIRRTWHCIGFMTVKVLITFHVFRTARWTKRSVRNNQSLKGLHFIFLFSSIGTWRILSEIGCQYEFEICSLFSSFFYWGECPAIDSVTQMSYSYKLVVAASDPKRIAPPNIANIQVLVTFFLKIRNRWIY